MTRLRIHNDTYVKRPGYIQKIILLIIVVYIIGVVVFSIPFELDRIQNYSFFNQILTTTMYIVMVLAMLGVLLMFFYYYSNSFEYQTGSKILTRYNDLVFLKIKREIKDLNRYKGIEVEGLQDIKKLVLQPKDETQKSEYLSNVDTWNFKKGIWKEFLEEVRKEIG